MIHVYDTVIQSFETQIERYGATYTLENRTRMNDQWFYTFVSPGRESLLVMPRFAEQYYEVEKFCQKYYYCKKLETCRIHLRRDINKYLKTDEVPNADSVTGKMHVIRAVYKDIEVEFNYMNSRMTLSPEFTIVSHCLFGNDVVVLMKVNEEGGTAKKPAKKTVRAPIRK